MAEEQAPQGIKPIDVEDDAGAQILGSPPPQVAASASTAAVSPASQAVDPPESAKAPEPRLPTAEEIAGKEALIEAQRKAAEEARIEQMVAERVAAIRAADADQAVIDKAVQPERRRIMLEENEAIPPTGLFLSLNGRSYMLKPGVPADVPVGVIDILKNAIMSVPVTDGETGRVIGSTDRMRYPFQYAEG